MECPTTACAADSPRKGGSPVPVALVASGFDVGPAAPSDEGAGHLPMTRTLPAKSDKAKQNPWKRQKIYLL
ncbi:hypothetical protein GCM10018953_26230 [Streptosporangium nondiastaticum]